MKIFKGLLFFVALPICFGSVRRVEMLSRPQAAPARLKFEVATIKPAPDRGFSFFFDCHGIDNIAGREFHTGRSLAPLGRCITSNATLRTLIVQTNSFVPSLEVLGGPGWVDTEQYDIEAKAEDPTTTTFKQLLEMLNALVIDRFKLKYHQETRERQGFVLIVAKNGPKLTKARDDEAFSTMMGRGRATFQRTGVGSIAGLVSRQLGQPVLDKTGLNDLYDISLTWGSDGDPDSALLDAVQEQLGLRLEAQKVPVSIIVIESAEKPTPN